MTGTADSKRRVVLPSAKPGDLFEVHLSGKGQLILTKLEPVRPRPARVRVEKRRGFSVGVVDRPISDAAIAEALSEFP